MDCDNDQIVNNTIAYVHCGLRVYSKSKAPRNKFFGSSVV